jgi:hypothetical protein
MPGALPGTARRYRVFFSGQEGSQNLTIFYSKLIMKMVGEKNLDDATNYMKTN